MAKCFRTQLHIIAAVPEAWAVLSDFERWPQWTPTVTSLRPLQASAPSVGAGYRIKQPKLFAAVYRISEWQPPFAFVWISRSPGMQVHASHRLIPENAGCRIELEVEFRGLFSAFAARFFGTLTQRYIEAEAAALKQRCEALALAP